MEEPGSRGDIPRPPRTRRRAGATGVATRVTKRAVDVLIGLVLCVVTLPVIVGFAAILAVQLRAWPFFVHHRVGRHGRPFRFPKLRTLARATPTYADKTQFHLEPVSDLARKLRRSHLDELPQLWLVPLGTMSLVGPRPRMASEIVDYPRPDFDDLRVTVRQGCTGLWQVGAHTDATVSAAPAYDMYYLRHASVRLDAWILWRTVAQALGRGAVPIDRVPRWTTGPGLVHPSAPTEVVDPDPDPAPEARDRRGPGEGPASATGRASALDGPGTGERSGAGPDTEVWPTPVS